MCRLLVAWNVIIQDLDNYDNISINTGAWDASRHQSHILAHTHFISYFETMGVRVNEGVLVKYMVLISGKDKQLFNVITYTKCQES